MQIILTINPDEALALIQVLEKDRIFPELTSRLIENLDAARKKWANEYVIEGHVGMRAVGDAADKAAIRELVAEMRAVSGCGCCRDDEAYDDVTERLALLLDVPQFSDGSGYNFYQFRKENRNGS